MAANQFSLLHERRFLPFFITQFLGALNDNFFKIALVIYLTYQAVPPFGLSSKDFNALCGGLFILPFFLFSALAGQLADKYDKAQLMRVVKVLEIFIMALGALGFWLQSGAVLLLALFLMGTHSTLFGPAKYAYLPQQLREEELVGGNGLVEMGTSIAILLGQIIGGVLIAVKPDGRMLVAMGTLLVAVCGYLAARQIPSTPSPTPQLRLRFNIVVETWRTIQFGRSNHSVFLAILGISWFWFFGLAYLSLFPDLTRAYLHGGEGVVVLLLTVFSVGVGIGSLLCEKISRQQIETGLIPLASLGLTLSSLGFYFAISQFSALQNELSAWQFLHHEGCAPVIAALTAIGFCGGLYIVPLYALMQSRSPRETRARVVAANNILNAAFMVGCALFTIGMFRLGSNIPQVLLTVGIINLAVLAYIVTGIPKCTLRMLKLLRLR